MAKTEWNWRGYLSHEEALALEAFVDVVSGLEDQIERIRETEKTIINNATIRAKQAKDKIRPFTIKF